MYYQNYEDYMRQVLGYPINDPSIYETYNYRDEGTYVNNQLQCNLTQNDINKLYPEIYNLIYPLVCRACDTNNEPISAVNIEKITDSIYKSVEKNQTIVNIEIGVENSKTEHNEKPVNLEQNRLSARQEMKKAMLQTGLKQEINKDSYSKKTCTKFENRENIIKKLPTNNENRETIKPNNSLLRDLIKILVLQRFLNKINKPPIPNPPRPNYPPMRPRFLSNRPQIGNEMNKMDINYNDYL